MRRPHNDETRDAVRGLLKREEDRSKVAILIVVVAVIGGAVMLQSREARRQQDASFAHQIRALEERRTPREAPARSMSHPEVRDVVRQALGRPDPNERDRVRRAEQEARDRRDAEEELRRAHERRERERLAAKERELAAERDAWRAEATAFVRRVLAGQDVGSVAVARDRLGVIAEHIYTTPELAADAREALKVLEGR